MTEKATKQVRANDAAKKKHQSDLAQSSDAYFPHPVFNGFSIQRKTSCACGGGCPACEANKRILTKLTVGEANDEYEQEADRVVDQVMAAQENSPISTTAPRIQRLAGKPAGQMDASPASVAKVLASPGSPLEPALKKDMEERFGHDFSRVRLHTGAAAEQSARDVNARAYTVGHDVVFGSGWYAPATETGTRLLAHELTHTIQQESAPQMTTLQRTPLDCGSPTLKCPPKTVLTRESANTRLGIFVHNIVQQQYVDDHQSSLGDENFILIDRGWGEIHTRDESSTAISRLGHLDPPVHGAFAKRAARGERATGTLARRLDILDDQLDTISEIKSCTPEGRQEGRNDLVDYFSDLALAREKIPPSGSRRPRKWHTSPWMPANMTINQDIQILFSMPERGLILYAIWTCQPKEDRKADEPPEINMFDWQSEPKGDQRAIDETKGKGNGESGKEKGNGESGKEKGKPGRDKKPEFPVWLAAAILAIAGFVVGAAKYFKPLRIGVILGAILGSILKWLGIGLAVTLGTAVATAGTRSEPGDEPSGPENGSPEGDPVRVPVIVQEASLPPLETAVLPTGPIPPPVGTMPRQATPVAEDQPNAPPINRGRSNVRPTNKGPRPDRPRRSEPRMIPVRISTIEKLDIEKFAVGRVAIVHLDPEGPDERVVIMQATAKVKGDRTTVEFTGLGECIFKTRRCERGRKTYTVKHPYRPSDGPGVSGIAVPSMMLYFPPAWNLDNLADVMEKEGRKADADEVRKVARRLAAEARRR